MDVDTDCGRALWGQVRVKGKDNLDIHLLALVGPFLEPLHSNAGSAFTELLSAGRMRSLLSLISA